MMFAVKRVLAFAALLAFLAALLAPATVLAQSKKHRHRAREHFQQAEAFMKVKVYDRAIVEYRAGYELMPSAHGFLFNIGLAYERMGNMSRAIEHYRLYLERDPAGKKRAEARARAVALERQLEDGEPALRTRFADSGELIDIQDLESDAAASDVQGYSASSARGAGGGSEHGEAGVTGADLANAPVGPELLLEPGQVPVQADTDVSWRQVAVGAGLFTLGVMFDASRGSRAYEGNLGDVIAIGLYTSGGYFVIRGVF